MPQIKVERIVSFTSEDPIHTASNIFSKDTSKKWKCKTPGEKSASIVLQFDQPYVINGIDIGNENSAYIEVLVSRSSSPEDFKVLLVMSSFMTPLEARQSQNVNKVRMFKQEDLSDPERNEKWDRVQIVCTQPFNRHVQYGLSFVNLYSKDDKNAEKPPPLLIGKFTIRPESPDHIPAGSLFARRKQLQENTGDLTLKGAAAIREATSQAHEGSLTPKQKVKHNFPTTPIIQTSIYRSSKKDDGSSASKHRKERNRNELLYSKDEEEKHDKIDKLIEKKAEEKADTSKTYEKERHDKHKGTPSKTDDKRKEKNEKRTHTPNRPSVPSEQKNTSSDKPSDKQRDSSSKESLKRKHTSDFEYKIKKTKKGVVRKPFAQLLEGVILVISGIQNPDRASLRSMALSMGAKYKPDWDTTCTHLVCAFANTPKFNQVKGKGKIVKRKWIEDCYNERKKLPWRMYALDKADQGSESEEEIFEKDDDTPSPEPNKKQKVEKPSPQLGTKQKVESPSPEIATKQKVETPSPAPLENYGINSDSDDDDTREQGSDTDDRIEEIRRKQADSKPVDIFTVDTDNEYTEDNTDTNLEIKHTLKNFFEDKIFYVDETFDEEIEKRIRQYIVAYKGIAVENLEVSIDIIVTNRANSKVLKDVYPNAICIAPDWIWDCHNCQKLVSMKDYVYD